MEYFCKNKHKIIWIILTLAISIISNSPAIGLISGLIIAIFFKNTEKDFTSKLSKYLLQLSVILLGFNLQINTVMNVGKNSILITSGTICLVLLAGYFLGKIFGLDKKLSTLISSGTAICGGSAIAAIAPAINANPTQIAISMGVVFLLNAVALFIFPPIGHFFHLSQEHFGLWAAIAIHDTSSVLGATVSYGTQAAAIGTTVKLTRALWVLPLSFIFAKLHKSQSKAKFPLFLIGFVFASIIRSFLPEFDGIWDLLAHTGKQLMTGTLFLIGLALSLSDIKSIGIKPLIAAILLWAIISFTSLGIIIFFKDFTFI